MALLDISRSVSPSTAVWPGDQEVQWEWTARIGEADSTVNVGALHLSTHTATHVDAPYHVDEEGRAIDDVPLLPFAGPADVVDATGSSSIRPEHVDDIRTKRVLFKTDASSLPDDSWPEHVTPLHPETVHRLADEDVALVGTDAPSVDPLESSNLPAHHALIESKIVTIEGLQFDGIAPGRYFLMAFPLKIENGDASPVRAVLSDVAERS